MLLIVLSGAASEKLLSPGEQPVEPDQAPLSEIVLTANDYEQHQAISFRSFSLDWFLESVHFRPIKIIVTIIRVQIVDQGRAPAR